MLLISGSPFAAATPPTLFNQPAYESPVRGNPEDLLMLPGDGFATTDTVVYQALTDTTQPLTAPAEIPTTSDADTGVAPVVSVLNVPHSLTVSLPANANLPRYLKVVGRNLQPAPGPSPCALPAIVTATHKHSPHLPTSRRRPPPAAR